MICLLNFLDLNFYHEREGPVELNYGFFFLSNQIFDYKIEIKVKLNFYKGDAFHGFVKNISLILIENLILILILIF